MQKYHRQKSLIYARYLVPLAEVGGCVLRFGH